MEAAVYVPGVSITADNSSVLVICISKYDQTISFNMNLSKAYNTTVYPDFDTFDSRQDARRDLRLFISHLKHYSYNYGSLRLLLFAEDACKTSISVKEIRAS